MREIFVSELVKEVLGPRKGIRETLPDSPLNEYITGVLAPVHSPSYRDIDSESEIPFTESQSYEGDADDTSVDSPPSLSPVLDPKSRPPSIGITFILQASSDSRVHACITWARYSGPVKKDDETVWVRNPRFFMDVFDVSQDSVLRIDGEGKKVGNTDPAEISLHVVTRKLAESKLAVSIYLVNRVGFRPDQPGDKPGIEHHIFQPQIRVVHGQGNSISVLEKPPVGEEERELAFLYRKRPVLARGHLVSAVWKEIDPEREFSGPLDSEDAKKGVPFRWIDGDLLPDSERSKFSPPDVRTEFVPLYSIPSPEFSWDTQYGSAPTLAASSLSECWDDADIHRMLDPLVNGYSSWIAKLTQDKSALGAGQKVIAEKLIEECKMVLARIKKGIILLKNDEDARLSFCFSNKAIDLQAQWARAKGLEWRPFQLAFILMSLESIANRRSDDRKTCDLLWVATGGGKTETYLALALFTIAYRRRRALQRKEGDRTGAGVSVLTRYTLRLLTIQQFRRALSAITAAEYLRVFADKSGAQYGWRPGGSLKKENLWGSTPFGIGLWVGRGVTPNKLLSSYTTKQDYGALDILRGRDGEGQPAQIMKCPACRAVLAVSDSAGEGKSLILHLVLHAQASANTTSLTGSLVDQYDEIAVTKAELHPHEEAGFLTLALDLNSTKNILAKDIRNLWYAMQQKLPGLELVPASASNPGYFFRKYVTKNGQKDYDFEIFCPNPDCPLHVGWSGGSAGGTIHGEPPTIGAPVLQDGNRAITVQDAFRKKGTKYMADRIPIPAYTVDDQIYHRLPSMVVATVDKFARPAFEPRASALFGNVDHHHCIWGYYRQYEHMPVASSDGHPSPAGTEKSRNYIRINSPDPPDLILQDELHLIEGPLGSQVGFYETAIDYLCSETDGAPVKYVASTATIKRAEEQVQSLFTRSLQKFPPYGIDADDRFFIRDHEEHPLSDSGPGRLYAGVCAPGRGPLTPLRNIFSRLLQTAGDNRDNPKIDSFWTMTAYFNAIRELAGARALYRQDVSQRISYIAPPGGARDIPEHRCVELSSRTESTALPSILETLSTSFPNAQDSLFTTSMFGTGVDISRIGLMVVNGQPKTTSAYIQSTGRAGRNEGALVVTFLRSSRPRDLNHYEMFGGYHRQLHRYVEAVTVYPLSPGVIERSGGPVCVFLLRNMRNANAPWHLNESPSLMVQRRTGTPEVENVIRAIENRCRNQPSPKDQNRDEVLNYIESKLDEWQDRARSNTSDMRYVEYVFLPPPKYPVVLGSPEHEYSQRAVVYHNAPQSLRNVEETAGFEV